MHKGIFGLCTCALVKPFGHFLVGLPFYFWRDMCGNNGDRANQHSQVVCESNAGRYVWYGIRRRLEQFRMRLGLAQYLVLPRLPASTRGCGCGARPGISKSRWSFCLAVFCFVLCAALVGVLCIYAYYGGGFLCTYAFVHNGGSAVFCSSTREFNCSDRR